jgi:hypothetical protein
VPSRVPTLFQLCVAAIDGGVLVTRESVRDKEFPIQDWVKARLDEGGIPYEGTGRNSYPDFPLVGDPSEGIEVKSLAYPGRDASYDANSAVPTGQHAGRTLYYAFARYPVTSENEYPVHDLVICHGDFLNPANDYIHENKSLKTFGAYGDIMIRDRKMYVVKTPYAIADGLAGRRTLILPAGDPVPDGLVAVGTVERVEAKQVAVGYEFNLRTNELRVLEEDNPTGGQRHTFTAYRLSGEEEAPVTLVEG